MNLLENQSQFQSNLNTRHRLGKIWRFIFIGSTVVAIIALVVLLVTIIDDSFGYAAITYKIPPSDIAPAGKSLETMSCAELIPILEENVSPNRFRELQSEKPFSEWSQQECFESVVYEVGGPKAQESWSLFYSIRYANELKAYVQQKYPDGELVFKRWVNLDFITHPQSKDPLTAGIRTAIIGSLYIIIIVIIVAFPIGIAAGIYLEEYASQSRMHRLIQTNINNLAGVPSIIYGMLGLAFFVRFLEPLTSGSIFGYSAGNTANGRTILAAGLTLSLLVLPVIIINSQEAIKAVPNSLREASYGMGATKWQTTWNHVLPNALSGILTGTILAVSRAFGETAP